MQKSTLWAITIIGFVLLIGLVVATSQTDNQKGSPEQEVANKETNEQEGAANNTNTTSLCPMEEEPLAAITPSAIEGWERVMLGEDLPPYKRYAFSGSVLLPKGSTIEPVDRYPWSGGYSVEFPLSDGDEARVTISIYELSSDQFSAGYYSFLAYNYLTDDWYTNVERPTHQNTMTTHNVYANEKCKEVAMGVTTALADEPASDVSTGHNIYRTGHAEDGHAGDDLYVLIHKKTDPNILSSQPPYIINFGYQYASPTMQDEGFKEEIRETAGYMAQSLQYHLSQPQ